MALQTKFTFTSAATVLLPILVSYAWLAFFTLETPCQAAAGSVIDDIVDEKEKDFVAWVARVGAAKSNVNGNSSRVGHQFLAAGRTLTVGKAGSGAQFSSVQDAVDAVSTGNAQRVVIQIAAGLYQEKVHVPSGKPYITFEGAGAGLTTISWHDTAASSGGMPKSASVAIDSHSFIARAITFANSAPAPPIGSTNKQAVALRVSGDKAAFYNCNFLGHQDTVYDDKGRHYFEGCLVQGSVDFICGNGQSLYKGCELRALQRSTEALTAQKRESPGEATGFSFVDCKVTGAGMAYLGRAWGSYSRVIFSFTYMADMIKPVGWYNWGDSSRNSKVFFGQYKCTGPGADQSKRVGWARDLTDAEAAPFQSLSFIDGASWLQS
ncbi:hypothetical protein GOP47_0003126 [Adiantum capillus-veneris]|uniref:pectinesterase n=1 Tax=Adiantum capillus-veneris TaxID=13818 RepID=A0A9D4VBV1_ADICA|nr:hypothetical protein GOP47_0003126 [Adiantum capillus-veneris]